MNQEYSGSGDPAKSLELLWRRRPQPTRGPKPALTVDQIVEAALRVADAEGLPRCRCAGSPTRSVPAR